MISYPNNPRILILSIDEKNSISYCATDIISYGGQVAVNGSPFTGTGHSNLPLWVETDNSHWSHDGTSTRNQPTYPPWSTMGYIPSLEDDAISGMGTINEYFSNHNDVHLRVWFSDGVNGFQQLTPDRRFASVNIPRQ